MKLFRRIRNAAIAAIGSCFAAALYGNGISVTAVSLDTHGSWSERWLVGTGEAETDEYYSASGPFSFGAAGLGATLSNYVSGPHQWERAWSASDAFNLYLASSSAPREFGTADGIGGLAGERIDIYSTATTRFRSANEKLVLGLFGDAVYNYEDSEQNLQASLRDVTSGELLLFVGDLDGPFQFSQRFDYIFSSIPTHEYELSIYGSINSFDSKEVTMNLHATLASVPDSAATSGMLSFGLLCLWIFARRGSEGDPRAEGGRK